MCDDIKLGAQLKSTKSCLTFDFNIKCSWGTSLQKFTVGGENSWVREYGIAWNGIGFKIAK